MQIAFSERGAVVGRSSESRAGLPREREGEGAMVEFLQDYGLWVALAGVFVAMRWFGTGCCGSHRKAGRTAGQKPDATPDGSSESGPRREPGRS